MALKLSLGIQKKVGLPDYGSLGASCHVEFDLDGTLHDAQLERFHDQVRRAYAACAQAVNDELARQQAGSGAPPAHGQHPSGNGNGRGSTARRATASQVRAICTIADRQGVELAELLRARHGVDQAQQLSISQASNLIDELKGATNGNGRQ